MASNIVPSVKFANQKKKKAIRQIAGTAFQKNKRERERERERERDIIIINPNEETKKKKEHRTIIKMMTLSASTSVLSVVGSLLLLQAFVATVHGALPPGYEDHWWCPSSSYCKRRLNKGLECTGRQSAFSDCYDPVTETSVEAVWTGSLSDMDAPEGWVLDPGPCPRTVVVPQVPCGRRGRQYTPSNSSQRVRRLRRLLLAPPRGRRQR